ncbi:hypothetical protein HPB52_025662 [Rhipicephalus sanguineus]|uniref:Uncharacterized protein n=1 Tax=Rhipicephalus sanguineus TaxID=34632 RepID=A0A9D4TCS6_RHISA|nr:hypothetical protein HPB52_025662 [Rhipicephalus sanguineus]
MPVTRNGTSSTAPTSEEDGGWRSTDGGEGSTSRGVPDSASTSGTTTTPAPAFDMAAVLQATVQAAVREAINGIAQLQSQQTATMPCVTIRREDADRIGIKYSLIGKALTIGGYGSGRVTPCGEANVNLTVDQAIADVPVLIVPNESQAIPVTWDNPSPSNLTLRL